MRDGDYIEIKAVSNIVADLENQPKALAMFLVDLDAGTHKKWDIYKKEISRIKLNGWEGRAVPYRKSKSVGGISRVFGKINGVEKTNPFIGQLKLEGLTKIGKIKQILNSDCSKEVKKEFLAEFIK